MKRILLLMLVMLAGSAYAQKIKVTSGKLDFLKSETAFTVSFSYENMKVGKMTEAEYLEKRRADLDKKGDSYDAWYQRWVEDREQRFEPKFIELFNKYAEKIPQIADEGRYNMHINTDFTEPGFNVGVARKNAAVSLSIVFTDNQTGAEMATVTVINSSASDFWGTDFDVAYRIQECYGKAGRELSKYIAKMLK
ncbi:MAG: hypothetical protein LBR64_01270 [Dysgonamonadaceae bacterium]|nr:hypothetical protein [Dysgonamonadaceae bacterium]